MADTKKTTPARSADKSPKKAPAPRKGGSRLWGFFKGFVATCIALALAGVGLALFVFALVYSQLPPIDTVVDYKPKVPMRGPRTANSLPSSAKNAATSSRLMKSRRSSKKL